MIAGGLFEGVDGIRARNVAEWDGSNWNALGDGIDGMVWTLADAPDDSIIAGGRFTEAGNKPAYRIARWDGISWSSIGSGMNAAVNAVLALAEWRHYCRRRVHSCWWYECKAHRTMGWCCMGFWIPALISGCMR